MYKRQVLRDQSPISIKQINDNFAAIFLKIAGNIDTMDLKDGAVATEKIKDKAVTGDKVLDGSLTIRHLEDGFTGSLNLLDNPIFTSLSSTVDGNSTLIQQNKDTITLQASHISDNEFNISQLWVTTDNINASVVKANKDIGVLFSEVDIVSGEISSKVGWTDFTGETIVSEINQSPSRVKISARNIDLEGITTVYSPDGRSYVSMGNRYGEMYIVHERHEYFSISYLLPGIAMRNSGYEFITAYEDEVSFPGEVYFLDRVTFSDRVYFDGGGVVVPRRSSDVIELDVWSNGLAVYRDGSHVGTVRFD